MPRSLTLDATDGYALAADLFEPEGDPRAAVLIAPATGVPRGYYAAFAAYLASRGMATLTFDYRGIGGSKPASLRGFDATMADWGTKDLAGALRALRERFPSTPRLLVGHSVGGQIAGLTPESDALDAMLFVSSQSGWWRNWSLRHQPSMVVMWHLLLPLATRIAGYTPMKRFGAGEDLPAGVGLEWARWARHPRYLMGWHGTRPDLRYARFADRPIRAYLIGDDAFYAPPRAVAQLLSFYGKGAESIRRVEPRELGVKAIGHFGFFRDRFRETLWAEAAGWLLSEEVAGTRSARPADPSLPGSRSASPPRAGR